MAADHIDAVARFRLLARQGRDDIDDLGQVGFRSSGGWANASIAT